MNKRQAFVLLSLHEFNRLIIDVNDRSFSNSQLLLPMIANFSVSPSNNFHALVSLFLEDDFPFPFKLAKKMLRYRFNNGSECLFFENVLYSFSTHRFDKLNS